MDLADVRRLLARLSPGPWTVHRGQRNQCPSILDGRNRLLFAGVRLGQEGQAWPDAEFVAQAPELVSQLLDELERMEATQPLRRHGRG